MEGRASSPPMVLAQIRQGDDAVAEEAKSAPHHLYPCSYKHMAKYVRIGPNLKNDTGATSKGWTIRRKGLSVVLRWGSVEVKGYGVGRRYYWAGSGPKIKIKRFRSGAQLRSYIRRRIVIRESHRYEKLPGKVRIHRPTN